MPVKLFDRQRYVGISYLHEQTISDKDLWKNISKQVLRLFGEQGAASTGLYLIEHNPQERQVLFRATNMSLYMLRAALCSITEINGEPIVLFVTHVSGTIKKAKLKAKPLKHILDEILEKKTSKT